MDDVITFKVGPTPNHPVLTGVTEVLHSTLERSFVRTGQEQCGARRAVPLMKDFQPVPLGNSLLHGTWALTEYFNPSVSFYHWFGNGDITYALK